MEEFALFSNLCFADCGYNPRLSRRGPQIHENNQNKPKASKPTQRFVADPMKMEPIAPISNEPVEIAKEKKALPKISG